MIIAIAGAWLVSLLAASYGGYKYGHSVASKAAKEALKIQQAAKDLQ